MEPTTPPNEPARRKPRTRGFRSVPPSSHPAQGSAPIARRRTSSAHRSDVAGTAPDSLSAGCPAPKNPTANFTAKRPPLPKRPKGRLFVGSMLVSVLLVAGWWIWNVNFRYQAYGTITGRIIHVPSPLGGNVRFLHVREGDEVTQGQLLVTLENVELGQRLARTCDELLITQADLDAEISKLQWNSQQRQDESARTAAEYFQLLGEIAEEHRRLEDLELKLHRTKALYSLGAATRQELDELYSAVGGKRGKLDQLSYAAAKRRQAFHNSSIDKGEAQLKPLWARIEALIIDIRRLRELIAQGEIRSPASGRVVRSHFFTGEQVSPAQVVCEILESGSLEAVVYVPQNLAERLAQDRQVTLHVAPQRTPLVCRVSRIGEQYTAVPENLQRYYVSNALVLPVYFRTDPQSLTVQRLRLGSEVKMPTMFATWLGAAPRTALAWIARPVNSSPTSSKAVDERRTNEAASHRLRQTVCRTNTYGAER